MDSLVGRTTLPFVTGSGNTYIYDDMSGVIIPATGEAARLAGEERSDLADSCAERLFARYRQAAARTRMRPAPWTPERVRMDNLLSPGLQLTLVVTERCTLRCQYCVYTGTYAYSRTHSETDMPVETALEASDFLIRRFREKERHNPGKRLALGFYGGEPLLRMDLIQRVVERVAKSGVRCQFVVTTNGTVGDDEIADFLVRHDFNIAISLDGPPSEHNRRRVFPDGRGSFDRTYGFLEKVRAAHRRRGVEGRAPYFVLATVDKGTDLVALRDFFDGHPEAFALSGERVAMVYPYRTTYYDGWSEEDLHRSERTAAKLWAEYVDLVSSAPAGAAHSFLGHLFGTQLRTFLSMLLNEPRSLRGSCVPGGRLAVDPRGRLHICERVNNNYPIGDISEGIDYELATHMLNALEDYFASHCGSCNVTRLCAACFSHVMVDGSMRFELPAEFCRAAPQGVRHNLATLFTVLERNPEAMAALEPSPDELEEDRIFNG